MREATVIPFGSVAPRSRDLPCPGDFRMSATFVDVGKLQARACRLSAKWSKWCGEELFPPGYFDDVGKMIKASVREIRMVKISPTGKVFFKTQDRWGTYEYSFQLNPLWVNLRVFSAKRKERGPK